MQLSICLSVSSIFLAALLSVSGIAQQSQRGATKNEERAIERLSRKPAPLTVKVIKTRKGEVLLGQWLIDGDDWFQGISVILENVSGKTITYIGVGFLFPRQRDEIGKSPPLYRSFSYGRHPSTSVGELPNVQPLALKPGETITVAFSDFDFNEVTAHLKQLEYLHSIKKIKINIQEIYFDDGTGWAAGTWLRLNPNTNSYVRDRQPISRAPNRISPFLDYNSKNLNTFSSLRFFNISWQETCTVQDEPPHGEIG